MKTLLRSCGEDLRQARLHSVQSVFPGKTDIKKNPKSTLKKIESQSQSVCLHHLTQRAAPQLVKSWLLIFSRVMMMLIIIGTILYEICWKFVWFSPVCLSLYPQAGCTGSLHLSTRLQLRDGNIWLTI